MPTTELDRPKVAHRRLRVLCVDDDEAFRNATKKFLERSGLIEVLPVVMPEEAEEILLEGSPIDAVLVDEKLEYLWTKWRGTPWLIAFCRSHNMPMLKTKVVLTGCSGEIAEDERRELLELGGEIITKASGGEKDLYERLQAAAERKQTEAAVTAEPRRSEPAPRSLEGDLDVSTRLLKGVESLFAAFLEKAPDADVKSFVIRGGSYSPRQLAMEVRQRSEIGDIVQEMFLAYLSELARGDGDESKQ